LEGKHEKASNTRSKRQASKATGARADPHGPLQVIIGTRVPALQDFQGVKDKPGGLDRRRQSPQQRSPASRSSWDPRDQDPGGPSAPGGPHAGPYHDGGRGHSAPPVALAAAFPTPRLLQHDHLTRLLDHAVLQLHGDEVHAPRHLASTVVQAVPGEQVFPRIG